MDITSNVIILILQLHHTLQVLCSCVGEDFSPLDRGDFYSHCPSVPPTRALINISLGSGNHMKPISSEPLDSKHLPDTEQFLSTLPTTRLSSRNKRSGTRGNDDFRFKGCLDFHDPRIRIGLTQGDRWHCWYTGYCPCELDKAPYTDIRAKDGILQFRSSCCLYGCSVNFRVQAPEGYELLFEFLDLHVSNIKTENSDGTHLCHDTQVFVMEDWYTFCGNSPPPPLRFMRRQVDFRVTLRQNIYCPPDGQVRFTLRYRGCWTTDISGELCPQQMVITSPGRAGYVTSPGFYWVGNYPPDTLCRWNISVDPGYVLRLDFETFRLPGGDDGDYLQVYVFDESVENNTLVLTYRTSILQEIPDYTIVLPSNNAVIEFGTDRDDSSKGFKINFQAADGSSYTPIVDELRVNCSGMNVSSLPDHIRCNFRSDCLDGRDEEDCLYDSKLCSESGKLFGKSCYYTYSPGKPISWEEAESVCYSRFGGHLATPTTTDELYFLKHLIAKDYRVRLIPWFLGIREDAGTISSFSGSGTGTDFDSGFAYRLKSGHVIRSLLYRRLMRSIEGKTVFNAIGQYFSSELSRCRMWSPLQSNVNNHLFSVPCDRPNTLNKQTGVLEKINVLCQEDVSMYLQNFSTKVSPIYPPHINVRNKEFLDLNYDESLLNVDSNGESVLNNISNWTNKMETFKCMTSLERIFATRRCDGTLDCFDGSDELDCESYFSSGTSFSSRFECTATKLKISFVHVCDGLDDCLDGQDESFCKPAQEEGGKTRVCADGQAVAEVLWCDAKPDCIDGSDETSCDECRGGAVLCPGVGCFPDHWVDDESLDCPIQDKDSKWSMEPDFIPRFVEGVPPPAIVWPDGYGKARLEPISDGDCPPTHAQCHSQGYCIPDYMLCNGVVDCPNGEDEKIESCALFCRHRYRCHGTSTCIHVSRVCDGWVHCPLHDDEMYCTDRLRRDLLPTSCLPGCQCHPAAPHLEMVCDLDLLSAALISNASIDVYEGLRHAKYLRFTSSSNNNDNPSSISLSTKSFHLAPAGRLHISTPKLVKLEAQHSGLKEIELLDAPQLYEIDVGDNQLQVLRADNFRNATELRVLAMSRNILKNIDFEFLIYLRKLESLDISYNNLTVIKEFSFFNCPKLKHINMHGMGIRVIYDRAFDGLTSLQNIDLGENPISTFGRTVLNPLSQLTALSADNFRLCCSQVVPKSLVANGRCDAPKDEISSCEDILASEFFRGFLWVIAILTITGNLGALLYRLVLVPYRTGRQKVKNQHGQQQQLGFSTFITSLAASDFLMGVYLCIIGGADRHYRGRYIWESNEWTRSVVCSLAGFLCFLSSEVSSLTIALVTLDRFTALAFPLSNRLHFRPRSARIASVIIWIVGAVLAGVPLLPTLDEKWDRFYSQNGVCIPLPITRASYPGKEYSFAVFIVFNLVIFIAIAAGQVMVFLAVRSNTMKTSDTPVEGGGDERHKEASKNCKHQQQQAAIARKLTLVVASDFICWMPIGILGLLSRSGVAVPGEATVAASVFLLPINAALNPFLYTLAAAIVKRKAKKRETSSNSKVKKSLQKDWRVRQKNTPSVPISPKVSNSDSLSSSHDQVRYSPTGETTSQTSSIEVTPDSVETRRAELTEIRIKKLQVWLATGKVTQNDLLSCLDLFTRVSKARVKKTNSKAESTHI